MMRARKPAVVPAVLAVLAALLGGLAAFAPAAHARVNAVGLVDFSKKNFKVGDWVRYRIDMSTSRGLEDMNIQEVRIVGEETFRGERCFWVETWVGPDSTQASYDLALVSYDVFKDVAPELHYRHYIRLILLGLDDNGSPEMNELARTNPNSPFPDLRPMRGQLDTLGVEPVETPEGTVEGRLVRLTRRLTNPRPMADSTINRITVTTRNSWMTRKIPVTSVVKEEETTDRKLQAYKLGTPSTDAPESLIDTLTRTAVAIAWGSGAKSDILDQWHRERGFIRPPSSGGMGVEEDPNVLK